jgi:hypothetical protein
MVSYQIKKEVEKGTTGLNKKTKASDFVHKPTCASLFPYPMLPGVTSTF